MADILPFRQRPAPAPAFDVAGYRTEVEAAAQACLDMAQRLVDHLDRIDGDPDCEPDVDDEDGGDAEPVLASLIDVLSQVRWVGFDGGAA